MLACEASNVVSIKPAAKRHAVRESHLNVRQTGGQYWSVASGHVSKPCFPTPTLSKSSSCRRSTSHVQTPEFRGPRTARR